MKKKEKHDHNFNLVEIADKAMLTHGLEPEYSQSALDELKQITGPAQDETLMDLTHLLWCSIDNDDSMDLDQITVAEKLPSDQVKIYVGVADVDAIVKIGSPIDSHAKKNTTSIYTGVRLYPMLPEKLSTDLTSLSEGEVRIALVIEMVINQNGEVSKSKIYHARVQNQVKLAYNGVGAWLEGKGPLPEAASKILGMDEQLRIQNITAQKMRKLRYIHGALELETIEARAVMSEGKVIEMKNDLKNMAHELIEDFMIAANGITAKFLNDAGYPSLRRVVRSPERWARIVEVAANLGDPLPAQANSKALAEFLSRRRAADPIRFPDISLTIVKLIGRGEYILDMPGQTPIGHFGLAVRDYSHSTAPNRRYPDLITHRLLKAALKKETSPYSKGELKFLADHCTEKENAADKVERQVRKSAAAQLMSSMIGERFEGLITGASYKGTWARIIQPPVEGKIIRDSKGLDVGDKVQLKLVSINVEKGYIDFERIGH